MRSSYIGKEYTKDPASIRYDREYVKFNPYHQELDYEATKHSIRTIGQQDPILMLEGLCVDGRHRTSIMMELGKEVKCIDLNPELSRLEIIALCNKNTMSGRDFTTAQKAIQALKLATDYGVSAKDASKMMKVDKRQTTYASTIKGFGRTDLLDLLMEGQAIKLTNMERPSKSIEVVCKNLKRLEEKNVVVDTGEEIRFSPEAYIRTEAGKDWFYSIVITEGIDENQIGIRKLLSELANYKFKEKKN